MQALAFPFDLHVLSTPPAFVLSQDQTLHKKGREKPKPRQKDKPTQTTPQRCCLNWQIQKLHKEKNFNQPPTRRGKKGGWPLEDFKQYAQTTYCYLQ